NDLCQVLAVQRGMVRGAASDEQYEAWLVAGDQCGGLGDFAGRPVGGGQKATPDLKVLGDLGCHQGARLLRLGKTGIGCHDHLLSRTEKAAVVGLGVVSCCARNNAPYAGSRSSGRRSVSPAPART